MLAALLYFITRIHILFFSSPSDGHHVFSPAPCTTNNALMKVLIYIFLSTCQSEHVASLLKKNALIISDHRIKCNLFTFASTPRRPIFVYQSV